VNPKEVSAGRITVDPYRDAHGDDDGGSESLILTCYPLKETLLWILKLYESFYMTQWPLDALMFSYIRVC
jgi:hypothetical protein